MKHWVSYEENLRGVYSIDDLRNLYKNTVNRDEFRYFDEWLSDMERSAVFIRHAFDYGPELFDALADFWMEESETEWSAYLFENSDDEEPSICCFVEECNGFFSAEVEFAFLPFTETKRELFACVDDAMNWCASWAHFPEEA